MSPVFQHQEESPTRAEGCQRSADLKSEECARPRAGVSQSAKVGGKNPPSGKQDCATKVSTKPIFVDMSSSNFLFRYRSGDQDNLVLSDSEPEESKLVNQSIEGDIDLAS